jgi:hypothetical protein
VPISIDEFDSGDDDRGETNAERVVRFLARNRDKAYRASEIAAATSVDENSIHPVLNRLESRGIVRHRQPYWAADPEAIRDAAGFHAAAAFLDEEYGPESREEWLNAAEEEGSPSGGGEDDGSPARGAGEDESEDAE